MKIKINNFSWQIRYSKIDKKNLQTVIERDFSVAEDKISILTKINTRLAGWDVRPAICQPQVLILSKTLDSKNKTFYIFLSMSFQFQENR